MIYPFIGGMAIHCGAEMKITDNVFILDIYDRYIIVVLKI